jgi:hypothetical protein
MASEPVQITLKVTGILERLNIPYLIGGSLASATFGFVRATMDTDLVADIQPHHIPQLVALFKNDFYIDADMILDAIQYHSSFNLIHLETMFKVDIFILKQRPFDQNQFQRRIVLKLGDSSEDTAYFTTAEDIILAKLDWYRAGGEVSQRQWRDVLGVLGQKSNQLDFEYLRKWALNLGVQDLLDKAIREANS